MKNLESIIELQKKRMGVYDEVEVEETDTQSMLGMLRVILEDIEHLQIQQNSQLHKQEKLSNKMTNIEELTATILQNQNKMIEKWGMNDEKY